MGTSLHYINPEDEFQRCAWPRCVREDPTLGVCPVCKGTGKIPSGKEPEIQLVEIDGLWNWSKITHSFTDWCGPYSTEALALEAARKELKRGRGADVMEAIERARKTVSDLCHKRIEWRMSIPADENRDPDLIIAEALRVAREEIYRLRAENERLKAENDAP